MGYLNNKVGSLMMSYDEISKAVSAFPSMKSALKVCIIYACDYWDLMMILIQFIFLLWGITYWSLIHVMCFVCSVLLSLSRKIEYKKHHFNTTYQA